MITNCQQFASGHRSCRGCTAVPQPIRYTLSAMAEEKIPVVIANATGCTEVTSTISPYTSWNVPYIHSVFANVAATAAGIAAAYKALERKGKIKKINGGQAVKKPAIIALAGDGGGLEVLGLEGYKVIIKYQGACGSCPSSINGTLRAIEGLLRRDINPAIDVVAA